MFATTKVCRRPRSTIILLAALYLLVPVKAAQADVWNWLTAALQDEEPRAEIVLPPGAIGTGPDETRVMRLGRDILELHPQTIIKVETVTGEETRLTVIDGTIGVKVEPRKSPSFFVHTPYLVAGVKGTEFEVSVTDGAAAVSVTKGRVAVKAIGVAGGFDVTPGKTATASSDGKGPKVGKTPSGGAQEAAMTAAPATQVKPTKSPNPSNKVDAGQGDLTHAGRTNNNSSGNGGGTPSGSPSNQVGGDDGESGDDGEGGDGGEGGDDDD